MGIGTRAQHRAWSKERQQKSAE